MKKCISTIFTVCLAIASFAQSRPVGHWEQHFNFNDITELTVSGERVFGNAGNGILSLDGSNNLDRLSVVNGLHDGGITAISWDTDLNQLVIGFEDGTIQFASSTQIETISTLTNANTLLDKRINEIFPARNQIFLATDLGLAVYEKNQKDITDIYQEIGPQGQILPIKEVTLIGQLIFVKTLEGLRFAPTESNLFDFNNWISLPGSESFRNLSNNYTDSLVFLFAGENYMFSMNENLEIDTIFQSSSRLIDMSVWPNHFILSTDSVYSYFENTVLPVVPNPAENASAIAEGSDIVISDSVSGFFKYRLEDLALENYQVSGPANDQIKNIEYKSNILVAQFSSVNNHPPNHISILDKGQWENIEAEAPGVYDAIAYENQLYLATAGGLYNQTSGSFVDGTLGDTILTIERYLDELVFGSLSESYSLGFFNGGEVDKIPASTTGTVSPREISVYRDQIWMNRSLSGDNGVAIWQPEEDLFSVISGSDGLGGSNNIRDYAFSYDDEAYIVTSSGIYSFFDISFIFQDKFGSEVLFEGDPILQNENITAILIDGGNRKWIGTGSGIKVFNDILDEQIMSFSKSNSPLPSNTILDLAYEEDSGLIYVLTDAGLMSYQSASSKPSPTHSNVRIFPNPVYLGMQESIAISNTAANAIIKITSMNGSLIQQIEANGSTASWNLKSINGSKVNPGIYLVFSSSSEGSDTFLGKIAVLE